MGSPVPVRGATVRVRLRDYPGGLRQQQLFLRARARAPGRAILVPERWWNARGCSRWVLTRTLQELPDVVIKQWKMDHLSVIFDYSLYL